MLNCFEESFIKNSSLPQEWQAQSSLDNLAAFLQYNWEQRSVFFNDEEVNSRQQFLTFTGQKGIHTNNYVGTIVFKGQQLNIFPKVFREDKDDNDTSSLSLPFLIKNLSQWIQYCNRSSYPFISISQNYQDSEDLRELFISLFLCNVEQILNRSSFYRYEDKVEDLSIIRGRIDFKDYINFKVPNAQSNKFKCAYSEFVFDNIVNQIIKYTCKSINSDLTSLSNKKRLRKILTRLSDVSDIRCTPADCNRVPLSNSQSQYAVILSMCKMFLLNQTASYMLGSNKSFCFLLPTELLFEGFISGFISEVLQNEAVVRTQASELPLVNNVIINNRSFGKAFAMRHDILVNHNQYGLFILDTKYKHLSRIENNPNPENTIKEVAQNDLNQVIAYAVKRGATSVYLLYPMYKFEEEDLSKVVFEIRYPNDNGNAIYVHVIRLPFVFTNDLNKTKNALTKAIKNIFVNQ